LLYWRVGGFDVLSVTLPEKIEERLERLAQRAGKTKAYYVRQAVIEHIEDLEDIEIADKRLENLQTGKTRTVPLSRLLRKYGADRVSSRTPTRKPRNGAVKN
jgi:RHH-type rel operon transcriptional repressor/antitoxin RelB